MGTNLIRYALLASAGVAAAVAGPATAYAQEQRYELDIPAQSLGDALRTLGRTTRQNIVFDGATVRGKRSPSVRGRFTASEALEKMLVRSGLIVSKGAGGVLMVRQGNGAGDSPETLSLGEAGAQQIDTDIIVTGSRIANATPTSPVKTLSRDDIDRSGATTAAGIIQTLPQNFSRVNASTSSIVGGNVGFTTQADLRGLGPEATLTLINGRRLSAAGGGEGRAVDLGMIPSAAIERVEILTDSGSALYGSDAIGGVINFIMKDKYEGASITARYDRNKSGGHSYNASAVLGADWSTGSVLGTVQYSHTNALRYDRIGLKTTDLTNRGGGDFRNTFASNPGNVFPTGFFSGQPFTTISDSNGAPVFTAAIPSGQDGSSLNISDLALNQSNLGNLRSETLTPLSTVASAYMNFRQEMGSVVFSLDGSFSRREAKAQGLLADLLFVPTTNPFSPFDEDVFVGYVFDDEFGRYRTVNNGWLVNAGFGSQDRGDWNWKVTGTGSRDKSRTDVTFPDAMALFTRLASADPAEAFNPFGDHNRQRGPVYEAVLSKYTSRGSFSLYSIDAQASGPLASLPTGTIKMAIGAEYRRENFRSVGASTAMVEQGDITIGAEGSRSVSAVFGELLVPIIKNADQDVDVSLAGRWEHYGDFGATFNPKIGFRADLSDSISIRSSWGKAFRAPSLRQLYAARGFQPAVQVFDPRAPGGGRLVFTALTQGGNPNLGPETAEVYSASVLYKPNWIPNTKMTITWFGINYDNRVRGALNGLDIPTFLSFEDQLPPGLVQRDSNGNLQTIVLTDVNSASTRINGIDFDVTNTVLTDIGQISASSALSVFTKYSDRLIAGAANQSLVGKVGNPPRWRARAGLSWDMTPWSISTYLTYVDGLTNETVDPRAIRHRVSSQTTLDIQASWTPVTLPGFTVRAGATNILNSRAPFVDGPQYLGVDPQNHSVSGRTIYLSVTKEFGGGR